MSRGIFPSLFFPSPFGRGENSYLFAEKLYDIIKTT
jgi:hypothetical protein